MKYRRKIITLALSCLVIFAVYSQLQSLEDEIFKSTLPTVFKGSYDFIQKRKEYINPQYETSYFRGKSDREPSDQSCHQYFKSLELFDLKYYQSFKFDKTLVKKRKWMSDRHIEWKSKILKEGKAFDRSIYGPIIENEYEKKINELSTFESHLRNVLSHFRILRRCPDGQLGDKLIKSIFSSELLDRGKSRGHGLVIPLYENVSIFTVANLLHVLRGLKVKLPIEIVYHNLEESDRRILEVAAHESLNHIPKAFDDVSERPFNQHEDFPPLSINFLEIGKPEGITVGDNYLFAKASLLCSFEIVTFLHPDIIPVTEDFASQIVDSNDDFKNTGIYFFQQPSWTHTQQRRILSGYHEINNFIRNYLNPQREDEMYFDVTPTRSNTMKKRYFEELFSQIIDHSMVIIDKNWHKYTLYVHLFLSLIQQNGYMETRLSSGNNLNLELLWLSAEILGLRSLVNLYTGVAVGVLTPPELANYTYTKTTRASELCSSSWGQISEVNDRLIYVQNYQLANWQFNPNFRQSLQRRYLLKGEPVDTFRLKLQLNPLWIDTVILPPIVSKPVFDYGEPSHGWYVWESFTDEMRHPYYCAYNVVGDASSGRFGRSLDLDAKFQNQVNYYMHLWLGHS